MDYVENLLQSIDQVVYHRLRDQKFDETIICTVTDTSKASRGLYVVSDGTIKFDAYSELTDYKVDEAVRVNIPKGDYSQKKYIIGRSVSEKNGNQPIVYNSPSAEILDISGNLCTSAKAKIIANGSAKEVLIWSNERLSEDYANSIYDSILISAQFQTFFSPYNVSKGTYGLRLKVIIAPKKASDKTICREYDLDSRDMFGDPYNYLLPSLQEAKFNFDVNESIQQMSLYLYQNDDFMYKNDTGTEQRLGIALMENIHASKIHIGLGTNLSTIEDNTVKIYTDDDLTYNSTNGTNQKTIKLIWYNKDSDHRYVGFSDGVVDASYDEMDYDKDMSNHNRLIAQASQGNIPNDYAGFELGARMSEISVINTSLKKLIDKDLYSNIKKFKNALAPINDGGIQGLFKIMIDYIENKDQGQAILAQLDDLYNFYNQGLKLAAAANQKALQYSNSERCYYIITDENEDKREKINIISGLRDKEELLFGRALDKDSNSGDWIWWKEVDKTNGSLGKLIDLVEDQLSYIKSNVVSKAANYLSTYNNWQTIINNILTQIEKYTLDLQKLSIGQAYSMYTLNHKVPQEAEPKTNYSSSALFESTWKKDDETLWISGEGLLNRIKHSGDIDDKGFESCTLLTSDYIKTDKTNGDDVDDNANKYQIYWYYERNGYTPGKGENPYGGPGWCEIGDSGSNNNVSRFTILNSNVKNIGLPQPDGDKYPTKPDENDKNGYLSILFSNNRPDIKEEKIKCIVIYNHEKYESNILTFKNEDPAAGPELTNAIQLVHGTNSRDIYSCYNTDNILTNASDKVTPRELKIEYLNERGEPETGEDSTLIGSTVYWYVPTGITMLTVDNKDLGIDETDDNEGFVCGSACERIYKVYRSISKVYYGSQLAQQSQEEPNVWRIRVDNNNIEFEFGETGSDVRILCNQTVVSEQVISKSNFTYNNTTCKVEFASIDKLEYTATRAVYNKGDENYYVYNAKEYSTTGDPPPGAIIQLSNNLVTLLFEYTKNQETNIFQNLSYGGITYAPSQDCCSIISGDGKSIVIKSGYVTLTVDEPDEYDKEGFAYYYKTINGIDDLTFKYRIKEHYSQSFINNTILCKVVKNNRVLEDSKMFTFSSQGVNGTNYSLVINAEDGAHAFFDGKYNFSISLFDYDGNQIPFTTQPKVKFYNGTTINLQKVLSNENGVLVYKGTVELINTSKDSQNHLIVTTTQPWPINSNTTSDNVGDAPVKNTNTITLEKIQPIAYAQDNKYIAEVPTEIIYDSSGSNPSYYKEPLRLYEWSNGDLQLVSGGYWTIKGINNTNNSYLPILDGQTLSDEIKKYKNGLASLKPLNMYITSQKGFDFCVLQYHLNKDTLLWSQPVVIMQNRFPSTLLNNWDNSLQINTNDGTILSNLVGAGRKNDDNSFSGVLMGDIDKTGIDNTNGGVFSNPHTGLGLYGFHNGLQSFGFNVDGTAFIGKAGGGRIAFDGNQGFIYSANWLNSDSFQTEDGRINTSKAFPSASDNSHFRTIGKGSEGMAIDLRNGHIDAYDFKLSSKGIQLNASPKDNESYFIIGDDTDNSKSCLKYDKDGKLTLRVNEMELIGTTENSNLLNNTGPWFYDSENNITQSWYRMSGERLIKKAEDAVIQVTGSKHSLTALSQSSIDLKLNQTYTLSGKIKIPQNEERDLVQIGFYIGGNSPTVNRLKLLDYYKSKSQYGIWHSFAFTITLSSLETNLLKIEFDIPVIYFKHLKLEKGNSATDWTASPQDVKQRELESSLSQDYIFNQLTNNGKSKGIYLGDYNSDGNRELFINANYINTGEINADLIKAGTINADLIKAGVLESQNKVMKINLENGSIQCNTFSLQAEGIAQTNNKIILNTNTKDSSAPMLYIGNDNRYIKFTEGGDFTLSVSSLLIKGSDPYSTTNFGNALNQFDGITFQNGKLSINATDVAITNLQAQNITGPMNTSVTIGGWQISQNSLSASGVSLYSSGTVNSNIAFLAGDGLLQTNKPYVAIGFDGSLTARDVNLYRGTLAGWTFDYRLVGSEQLDVLMVPIPGTPPATLYLTPKFVQIVSSNGSQVASWSQIIAAAHK